MELPEEEYRIVQGLMLLTKQKLQEAYVLEKQLHDRLGLELGSHLSDLLYSYDSCGLDEIDHALQKEDITVSIGKDIG